MEWDRWDEGETPLLIIIIIQLHHNKVWWVVGGVRQQLVVSSVSKILYPVAMTATHWCPAHCPGELPPAWALNGT